jgi:hypothetical protein
MFSLLFITCVLSSETVDTSAVNPLICSAANAMAAPFCETIEDWANVAEVTTACLQAEVAINTMYGFLHVEHLKRICNHPDQMEAVCASVQADDDMTTCELGMTIENGNVERRLLHHLRGCFDEMTLVQTRNGEKYVRDVVAGEEILTCEAGVYTRVFANVDHQDEDTVPLIRLETKSSSLTLTGSHFVLSNGQYVRARDMKVGMTMDGESITRISPALGRRRNVVALRQDIIVNGVCGTWVDSSFAAVLYVAPIHRLMNPWAAYYPQFIFSTTQKLADVVVPLIDDSAFFGAIAAFIMVTVSLMLAAGNLTALTGLAWFFYYNAQKPAVFTTDSLSVALGKSGC